MIEISEPPELQRCRELQEKVTQKQADPAEEEEYLYLAELIAGSIGPHTLLEDLGISTEVAGTLAAKRKETARAAHLLCEEQGLQASYC